MSNPPPFNNNPEMMNMRMNGGSSIHNSMESKSQASTQALSPNSQVFSGNRSQTYNHAVPMNPNNNNSSNSLNNLNINNQNFNHQYNHQQIPPQNLNANNQFGSNYSN
jgi:hypothetical protein